MKILTGEFKGRPIFFSSNHKLRPTQDKLRKAVMDTLQGYLVDKITLDLFSGTGAMGMEFLSNGAKRACFVERNPEHARAIQLSLDKMGQMATGEVLVMDVIRAIMLLAREKKVFDVIFMDPPYFEHLHNSTLKLLKDFPIYHAESLVIMESRAKEKISLDGFEMIRQKNYGDAQITFLKASPAK